MRDLKVKGGKNMEISSDQLNSILRERRRGERKRECVGQICRRCQKQKRSRHRSGGTKAAEA